MLFFPDPTDNSHWTYWLVVLAYEMVLCGLRDLWTYIVNEVTT